MEKHGKKYGLLLLLILFLPTGCTRDVELELPYMPPRLVLNASVTPEQDVSAFLSKSWFLLDSVPDSNLEGGTIRVYINDRFQGIMQQTDLPADSLYPKGQFSLPGCRVKTGDRLRLEAEAPGMEPVSGETWIPMNTPILSVDTARFVQYENGYLLGDRIRFYIKFHDNPDVRNFYRLLVERVAEYRKGDTLLVTSSMYNYRKSYEYEYGSFLLYEDPVFQSVATNPTLSQLDASTCRGTFTDAMFNGREYTVRTVFTPVSDSYRDDTVSVKIYYDIRLMAISEDYYHYLTEIRNFSIFLGDAYDGLLEPTATYSNVQNGFGVLTGYQIATWRIEMPYGNKRPYMYYYNSWEDFFNYFRRE